MTSSSRATRRSLLALAAVRDAVVGPLRLHRIANLAAALRTNAWSEPGVVLGLLDLNL